MTKTRKILIVSILVAAALWGVFAVTRYSDFTAYIPFSGRVFDIDPEQVDRFFIQNGTTGEQMFFETAEEKEQIARQLNSLRYRLWFPTLPIAKGGWSWRVAIEADGKQCSYPFGDTDMIVNGIAYVFSADALEELRQYAEK